MDSTKLDHSLSLRARTQPTSLKRKGFFRPKRPSLFLFVDRGQRMRIQFNTALSAFRFCSKF